MNDTTVAILEKHLGSPKKAGSELAFYCPFCAERGFKSTKKKLHVNVKTDLYNCFRCEYRGRNAEKLVAAITGDTSYKEECDIGYRSSVYALTKEKIEKDVEEVDLWGVEAEIEEDLVPLHKNSTSIAQKARKYLQNRGFTDKDINFYNVHYGYEKKYKDMIVFPVYLDGVLVFYSGRSFITAEKAHPSKFKAPTGKSGCMFNYDEAKKHDTIVVTEGIFDAFSCGRNAVAIFGKKISDKQVELLGKTKAKEIVICLDSDAVDCAHYAAKKLAHLKKVKILILSPDEGDANDLHGKMPEIIKNRAEDFGLKAQIRMKLLRKNKLT